MVQETEREKEREREREREREKERERKRERRGLPTDISIHTLSRASLPGHASRASRALARTPFACTLVFFFTHLVGRDSVMRWLSMKRALIPAEKRCRRLASPSLNGPGDSELDVFSRQASARSTQSE